MIITHLAAFKGNSGDNISHGAFQQMFKTEIDNHAKFEEVEIREFYKNSQKQKFDDTFLEKINASDLFVIGGGQFFDARWSYSETGTTLNWSNSFIDKIGCPILFNGVGYAEPKITDDNFDEMQNIFCKFKAFIEKLLTKKCIISLRNDGSFERIKNRYGADFAKKFKVVVDNGFYFDKNINKYVFENKMPTLGINIANDQFDQTEQNMSFLENFNKSIAKVITTYADNGYRIMFLPHMPRDLKVISELQDLLEERIFRFNTCIAPYNPADTTSAKVLVSYYKACDVIVSMRLHSNIITVQNAIPVVGLCAEGIVGQERIKAIYDDLGIEKFCMYVSSDEIDISEKLIKQIEFANSNKVEYKKSVENAMQGLYKIQKAYIVDIKNLLN